MSRSVMSRQAASLVKGAGGSMNIAAKATPCVRYPVRHASTETSASTSFSSLPPAAPRRPLVRTSFIGLTLLGVLSTGVGLYVYYNAFSTWPKEIRDDLRLALKAQKRGHVKRSEAAYRSALQTAQSLTPEQLGSHPLLKISGISIALGALLEGEGKLTEAYEVYSDALEDIKVKGTLPEERMRAVALAQKCGDLTNIKEVALALSQTTHTTDEGSSLAEDHLRWSVEELLRLAVTDEDRKAALSQSSDDAAITLADLELPPWISSTSLGASLEALGQLYASQRRSEYAIPLYVQAINLLMPANAASRKRQPTVSERCRTGILMNNVAQLLVDAHDGKARIDEATSWALKGLDIVAFALRGAGWDEKAGQGFKTVESSNDERTNEVKGLCWTAEVALLLNVGELARLKKDDCKAREVFQRAYIKADRYGMREARSRAAQALSELERRSK